MATKKTSEEKEVKETVKKTDSKKTKGKKVTKKAVTDMFKELNVSVDKKATCVREDDAVAYLVKNNFAVEDFINEHSDELSDIQIVRKMGVETLLYNTKYNISFACDGIIKYKNNYYIIEFKTEGANKFSRRTGVDESHINQASAYSLSLGLDNVLFVYIDRDSLKMKTYLLSVTDTMRERVSSKIEMCNYYVSNNILPPKEKSYKNCMFCQYKNYCESV